MAAGILVLDKPRGWTSHDVVAAVRRLTRVGKAGHAGTLDPMATGVLLVCVGYAARLSEYLQGHDKSYLATVRLGTRTDTWDADGEVVQTHPVPALGVDALAEATAAFVGDVMQTPPVYSAIKQAGVPLHRRARRGEAVQAAPRAVRIHSVELAAWQPPDLTLRVFCSAGTYVRALANDLGERLGCGAHLAGLVRLSSGPFALADACAWERFAAAAHQGTWSALLRPPAAALVGFVALPESPDARAQLAHGRALAGPEAADGAPGYVAAGDGHVVAILHYDAARQLWQPDKVFLNE